MRKTILAVMTLAFATATVAAVADAKPRKPYHHGTKMAMHKAGHMKAAPGKCGTNMYFKGGKCMDAGNPKK